ncbi:MAG: hypothetical protein RIQ93_3135, partial [Verrucomicrobiota bacterium]
MSATSPLTGSSTPTLNWILPAGDAAAVSGGATAGSRGAPGEQPQGETLDSRLCATTPQGSLGELIGASAAAGEADDSVMTLVSAFKKAMAGEPAIGLNHPLLRAAILPRVGAFEFDVREAAVTPAPDALAISSSPVAATGALLRPGSSDAPIALQPPGPRNPGSGAEPQSSDTPAGVVGQTHRFESSSAGQSAPESETPGAAGRPLPPALSRGPVAATGALLRPGSSD